MIPPVETYRKTFGKTTPVGAQYQHFEEEQRVISHRDPTPLRGAILRFWCFESRGHAVIRTDSGVEHSCLLSDIEVETALEQLARSLEKP